MEMIVFLQVSRFSISLGLEYFFFFFYRGDFEIFRQRNFETRNITRAVNFSTPFCRKVCRSKDPLLTVVTVARWSVSQVCNIALRGCTFCVRVFVSFLIYASSIYLLPLKLVELRNEQLSSELLYEIVRPLSLSFSRARKSFVRTILRKILEGNLNFNIIPFKRVSTIIILYAFRIKARFEYAKVSKFEQRYKKYLGCFLERTEERN